MKRLIEQEQWELILFTQPDIPWEDDGQRNLSQKREAITQRFKQILDNLGHSYAEIRGTGKKRLESAIQAVGKVGV